MNNNQKTNDRYSGIALQSSAATIGRNSESPPHSYRPIEILPPREYKSLNKNMSDKELKESWLAASETAADGDKHLVAILKITTEDYDRENEKMLISGAKLDHYRANPVILWNHDTTIPAVGKALDIWASTDGALYIEAEFDNTDEFAGRLFRKMQQGIIRFCSIGFIPLAVEEISDTGDTGYPYHTRSLIHTSWELFEVSLVNVPMNPYAGGALFPNLHNPNNQEKKQYNKNKRGDNMSGLYNPETAFEKISERLHKNITETLSEIPSELQEIISDRCIKNIYDPIYDYSNKDYKPADKWKKAKDYFSQYKAGRKISNTNMNKLSQAKDLLSEVIDSATVDNESDDTETDESENKSIKPKADEGKRKVKYSAIAKKIYNQ